MADAIDVGDSRAKSKSFSPFCNFATRSGVLSRHSGVPTHRSRRRQNRIHWRSESRLGADRRTRGPGQGVSESRRMQFGHAVPYRTRWLESLRRSPLLSSLLRANDGFRRTLSEARCSRRRGAPVQLALQARLDLRIPNAAHRRAQWSILPGAAESVVDWSQVRLANASGAYHRHSRKLSLPVRAGEALSNELDFRRIEPPRVEHSRTIS